MRANNHASYYPSPTPLQAVFSEPRRYNGPVITPEEWKERQRQWAEFNRWERAQPPTEYSPEQALEALDALFEWVPGEARTRERDPERRGVQRMHALLRLVDPR